jgi:hypothetical protein
MLRRMFDYMVDGARERNLVMLDPATEFEARTSRPRWSATPEERSALDRGFGIGRVSRLRQKALQHRRSRTVLKRLCVLSWLAGCRARRIWAST